MGALCSSARTVHNNYLREKSDVDEFVSPDNTPPFPTEPRNAQEAIFRLQVGDVVSEKYRIDSSRITEKGYTRTAVDTISGGPVSLKFCKDEEVLQKGLENCKRLNGCKSVCELVDKIHSHGMLPDCLVLQRGQYTLHNWLGTPAASEENKIEALRSIVAAVEELNRRGFVICTVNPENLTFCPWDQQWKLQCPNTVTSKGKMRIPALTDEAYVAPEILEACLECSNVSWCDSAADAWSLGVISYELLTGERFYDNLSLSRESRLKFLRSPRFSQKLKAVRDRGHRHFIKKFLRLTPSKRQTAASAVKRLSSLKASTVAPIDTGAINHNQEVLKHRKLADKDQESNHTTRKNLLQYLKSLVRWLRD